PPGPAQLRVRAQLRSVGDQPMTGERELGNVGAAPFQGGVYQLFVGLGVYPPDVVAARFFDSWLGQAEPRHWASNPTGKPPATSRSVSQEHVRIGNQLSELVDAAVGPVGHPVGPGLALLGTQPVAGSGTGQSGVRTTFDTLGFTGGPFGGTGPQ